MMTLSSNREVLHYVGYDDDRGGIVAVVRTLAATGVFQCVLGVNPGFVSRRQPELATVELPRIAGEAILPGTLWRARVVARSVRQWLHEEDQRIFHGHSRAGLLVALWLRRAGERRVVASIHSFGRQRWFYRWAAHRLGDRIFWLTPAMKHYYRIKGGDGWDQCIPDCVPGPFKLVAAGPRDRRPLRIGAVGALVPVKQWDLILQALAELTPRERAEIRFIHIGGAFDTRESRDYVGKLFRATEALGLGACVEWRGEQPSSQALLAHVDCCIVPSEREALSVALLEALAAGVPVLAADGAGGRDVIIPGRNGWVFRSGDASDLARVLAHLINSDALENVSIDPEDLRRFRAPVVAAQWVEVYRRISSRD